MGLDMYLTKKIYIGANYDHRNVKCNIDIKIGDKQVSINPQKISYIVESAGYWRKANHIHKWFVDNCQDGKDECQESYVSREQLQELLNVCVQVKNDHVLADKLLPVQSGFFFGSTEYDDYYFSDIDDTIKIIEAVLSEKNDNTYPEYYYHASW